jgi:2-oxoglutarate dehydrogenase E2 component (dihydrolipoamide succinyltransferase)
VREIRLPKLNNNDTTYVLVEWCFNDGDEVGAGEIVAVIETSKALEDLVTPDAGVLHRDAVAGAECRYGDVLGLLFPSKADRELFLAARLTTSPVAAAVSANGAGSKDVDGGEVIVTEPARELVRDLGIDEARLRTLGKRIIKRADVEALARADAERAADAIAGTDTAPTGTVHRLSHEQRLVAGVVARSHATIPAAFTAMTVDATRVAEVRRELDEAGHPGVGVTELLIAAIASLRAAYPLFFGSYQDDDTVLVPGGAHVGVTIDVGHGLYLPVVRDAGAKTVVDIAATLAEFQRKARTSTFRKDDVTGANIGLSLTTYTDVVVAQPIVFPGHSCMLSLTGTRHDLVRESSGDLVSKPRFTLGISYDHRVANGRDAVIVLRELKATFERPGRLAALVQIPGAEIPT